MATIDICAAISGRRYSLQGRTARCSCISVEPDKQLMIVEIADLCTAFGSLLAEGDMVGPLTADMQDKKRRMFLSRRVHLEGDIITGVQIGHRRGEQSLGSLDQR